MATRKTPFRGAGLTRARLIFAALLVLIVAAGIILTGALQRAMWRDFESDGRNEAALLYGQLMTAFKEVDHSALNMSETPLVKGALTSDRAPERDRANAVLDRYQKTMDVSICYLMDTRGLTVASSNRMAADSFVGKSFAFRPYFTEAVAGRPGNYFARGSVSNKRGYYASAPVRDAAGRIIGVAVVKDELDELEEAFRQLPHSFLVSPDGIAFLTSEPNLTFRILWPAAPGIREKLAASKQFGTLDFAPILQREPADASHLKYDGDTHYVFRLPLPLAGWSIVHLKSASTLASYRLFGALATVFVCTLALLGYLALSQSEQRRRLAEERLEEEALWARTFDAVGDLIAIIGPDQRIRRVNKAMALRLGMEPADMVGRHCYELVHGTEGPIESCPHLAALKTGVRATIEAAVPLLAGEFAVTASPLLSPDGTVEGSVHIMQDITERRRSEESLRESERRFRSLFDSSRDAMMTLEPPSWQFTSGNPAAVEMFGAADEAHFVSLGPGEVSPERQPDGRSSADKAKEMIETAMREGRHFFEWTHRRVDGPEFPATVLLSRIALAGKTFLQATVRDVTASKRAGELLVERAQLQELSAEVGAIWLKGADLPATLQASAETVVAHLDAAFARIWLLNPEEDILELKASAGLYTRLDGARSRVPVNESKIGVIAAKRRPHLTNAVVGDPGVVDQEWARREGLVAFAGYPLLVGERLWGVLAMFARHRLSDYALDELGVVAEKIATGIGRTEMEKALKRYAETQEVLLREVNHRVKNNLAVIISLLHKEEDRAKLKGLTGTLPALRDLHDRIEGLLIVHGMLSSAKWQDLKISELCSALVSRIARSLAGKMTVTIGETAVTVNSGQAHYLALVLNELVTNTLKYAAPFSGRPEIAIAISRDGDTIVMEYRDNGPGYPEAVVNGDYSGTSIGFDLMNGIVRQSLRGRISYRNENGAVAQIVFPG